MKCVKLDRRFVRMLIWLGLLVSSLVRAEWVTIETSSPIYRNDLPAARQAARKDAIDQARLRRGGDLQATDEVVNGRLTRSSLSLKTEMRIGRVVQVDESVVDDWLSMTFRIQLLPQPICNQTPASRYRKKVVFTRFALDRPDEADFGGLYDIDEQFPQSMLAWLGPSTFLDALNGTQLTLYQNTRTAPTQETEYRTLSHAIDTARSLGAQFVVGGIVRRMALTDASAYSTSPWGRLVRAVGQVDMSREFVVDMYIYDGFSGAMMFQKRYQTIGKWNAGRDDRLPLTSVGFAQTGYGTAVLDTLAEMASDVEVQVACQPFITRIRKVENKMVMIESGATQGLRIGDELKVYRTRQLFEGTRFQGTEIRDVKLALKVNQVQPELAFGELQVDPTRYNIQTDDLLILW
ncbi:MAG: flagellar assembly protein T N-terminal domain-containing protein [Hahellaceae bacterium]|nr:flagellar assembly protein T N-terminal domain-containing protein [Hahellaceae bacterium]